MFVSSMPRLHPIMLFPLGSFQFSVPGSPGDCFEDVVTRAARGYSLCEHPPRQHPFTAFKMPCYGNKSRLRGLQTREVQPAKAGFAVIARHSKCRAYSNAAVMTGRCSPKNGWINSKTVRYIRFYPVPAAATAPGAAPDVSATLTRCCPMLPSFSYFAAGSRPVAVKRVKP
jgi:hypothetical protein